MLSDTQFRRLKDVQPPPADDALRLSFVKPKKRVIVVGGGIIGLSTAYYCVQRGWDVILIDRHKAERDGCSFGNAGMIVPSHFTPLAAPGMVALGLKWMKNPESPFYIKPRASTELLDWMWKFWRASTPERVERAAPLLLDLSLTSRALYEELAALPDHDFGLAKNGLLMLCRTPEALAEESHTAARAVAMGLPAEVLDGPDTAAVDPNVRMRIAGSVYYPMDCHLQPARLLGVLQSHLEAAGARFVWDTEVVGWLTEPGQITAVRLSGDRTLSADEYVICGGSWSPLLVQALGLKIPLQAGKGYSLTLPEPRQSPRLCAIFCEARMAVTPMGSSLRFGGTLEMSGLNQDINPRRVQGIIKAVSGYYPDFSEADFKDIQPWCGLRPCSPDGLPYLGRTSKFANLVMATGHAMMGISLGPVSGKLVADIIAGEPPKFDLSLLSPDRYK